MIVSCGACGAANRIPAKRLDQGPRCGRCKAVFDTDKPLPVRSVGDFDELLADSPRRVLVDFWAPWCGPCLAVAPQLEFLAKKKRDAVVVAKVNTEELPELGGRFQIRSIPTMVLFDRGREQRRISGAMGAEAIAQGVGL